MGHHIFTGDNDPANGWKRQGANRTKVRPKCAECDNESESVTKFGQICRICDGLSKLTNKEPGATLEYFKCVKCETFRMALTDKGQTCDFCKIKANEECREKFKSDLNEYWDKGRAQE